MIFRCLISLILILGALHSENTAYTVDGTNGADNDGCLTSPQTQACATIAYLLKSKHTNVDVTVAAGTYTVSELMEITDASSVTLTGETTLPVVVNQNIDLCWKFNAPESLSIINFSFQVTNAGAISIIGGSSITFESLVLGWGEEINTWINAIVVSGATPVIFKNITVAAVNIPSDILALPYAIELSSCAEVTVDTASDTAPALGFLSVVNSTTAALAGLTLTSLVSNKLYFAQTSTVSITSLTTPSSSADASLANSEMQALATHISSMSAIDVELQRRVRLSSEDSTDAAAVVHLVYITGATSVVLDQFSISNIHTAALYIGDSASLTLKNSSFSENVHAFSKSCYRAASSSSISNRLSTPLGNSGAFNVIGEGVTLTLQGISESIEITDTNFTGNSISYSADSLTEKEASFMQLNQSPRASYTRRRYGSGQNTQNQKIVQVVADVFIDKLDASATVTISGVIFDQEHMSYDETYLADSEKDKHFIVSDYAELAPTSVNMRHVLSSRSSCCVFVAEGGSDISLTDTQFTSVQGSAVAMVDVSNVRLSNILVSDLTTQANVFSESAFYFGNLPNTTSNPAASTSLTLQNVNVTNVQPSPLSAKFLNIDNRGDSGFVFAAPSYDISAQRFLLPELGGGVLSVDWFDQVSVSASNVQSVSSTGNGGAFDFRAVGSIRIANTNFSSASSLYGAGGCVSLTDQVLKSVDIDSVIVADCSAQSHGGAFYLPIVTPGHDLALSISHLAISNCKASEGGGLFIGSRSEAERLDTPTNEAQMTIQDVNVTSCTSFYGAGMYLGSLQHVCYVTMDSVEVTECSSSLSGAAVYIAASLYIPSYYGPSYSSSLHAQDSRYGLHLTSCTFSSNIAGAYAGGLFTNVFSVPSVSEDANPTTAFTPLSSRSLDADVVVPAIFAENCTFTENKCTGSNDLNSRYGTHGGAAFAQYIHTSDSAQTSSVVFNTLIQNCVFKENDGGAYAPLNSVSAYISGSTFDTNYATFFENDTQFILNIECAESHLNVSLDNTFSNNRPEITHVLSYLCDTTCSQYTESATGKKCASPKSVPPEPSSSDLSNLDPDDYPVIPQLNYTIGAFSVGTAKVVISTSAHLDLNDGASDLLDQVLLSNKVRQAHGYTPLSIYATYNKQHGNTTLSVSDPIYRPTSLHSRAAKYLHLDTLLANSDAVHVQPATATATGKLIDNDYLTFPLTEVQVVTDGDNFRLNAQFPSDAPDHIYAYVSADGVYWTDAISLDYVHPLSQEDKNKWGYITIAIMFGMILLFLIIILLLQLCIWGLQKRYHADQYNRYEPI